jgi:hypothetical protein
MADVPDLGNGMPRVDWDADDAEPLKVLVTEDGAVSLMATDSGLTLDVEHVDSRGLMILVRARRVAPCPELGISKDVPEA